MTFLELCQSVRQDCGIQGSGPVTVTGQTGLTKRIIDWVVQADLDIQNLHPDWGFMWRRFSGTLAEDETEISTASGIGRWDLESFVADLGTDTGFRMLSVSFRESFQYVSEKLPDKPYLFYVAPDNSVSALYPSDDEYTITANYWLEPVKMTANGDVPLFAERFHRAIVERAKMFFYQDEEVPTLYQIAEKEYVSIIRSMERDYLESGVKLGLNVGPEMVVRPI
jgi:hypothetical protein